MSEKGEVRLSRRVTFSSGHRYWLSSKSEAENRALFGPWASPFNHGHNYALEACVAGTVDPETGMVVNIKDIDRLLDERIVAQFDQKSINDEIAYFAERPPTLENLLLYIRDQIGELPTGIRLVGLTLYETESLWGAFELNGTDWKMTLTRSFEFAASHRLHNPTFAEERNWELYGKCNNPAGHGHNYVVEVTVEGEVDPLTGMMVDLLALDRAIEDRVAERYDHKNLDVDLPEFQGKVTTSEVIVEQIWKTLEGNLPAKLSRVRLYETPRSYFEVAK